MMRKAVESRRWSMRSPPGKKRGMALWKRFKGRREMEKIEKLKVERPVIEEKKGRKGSGHTAEDKCRAVLSGDPGDVVEFVHLFFPFKNPIPVLIKAPDGLNETTSPLRPLDFPPEQASLLLLVHIPPPLVRSR